MRRGWLILRRILYTALLFGAGAYYIFNTGYLSWILLLVVALLPVLSLFVSLPLLRKGKAVLRCRPEQGSAREGFAYSAESQLTVLPMPVRVKLQIRNLFTGETQKRTLILRPGEAVGTALYAGSIGVVECRIISARALDLLRLFSIRIPVSKPSRVLLVPDPIPFPEEAADAAGLTEEARRASPSKGMAEREWKDVREYREGDLLRDIHWKLSSRRNQVIVREYEESGGGIVPIEMHWCGPQKQLEQKLSRLFGLLAALKDADIPFQLHLIPPDREELPAAENRAETELLLWELLSRPCPAPTAGKIKWTTPSDWALAVEADAILLCRGGEPEEVVA